jgi:hypothetical protein
MQRLFRVWYNYKPLYKCSSLFKLINNVLYVPFHQTYENIHKENAHLRVMDESNDAESKVFINQLMNLKNRFSDIEVQHEILTFIVAVSIN